MVMIVTKLRVHVIVTYVTFFNSLSFVTNIMEILINIAKDVKIDNKTSNI